MGNSNDTDHSNHREALQSFPTQDLPTKLYITTNHALGTWGVDIYHWMLEMVWAQQYMNSALTVLNSISFFNTITLFGITMQDIAMRYEDSMEKQQCRNYARMVWSRY